MRGGLRPAAVERAAVPARGLRAVRAAAVGHLPQRVPDRLRRPGQRATTPPRRSWCAGHRGLLRADRLGHAACCSPRLPRARPPGQATAEPWRAVRLDGGPGLAGRRGLVHPRPASARRAHQPDHARRGPAGSGAMTMTSRPAVTALREDLCARVGRGDRFAGLFAHHARGRPAGPVRARRDGGRHRHAGGAAAARRGRLSRAHPAAGRGVLVRAGDPRPTSAWSPRGIRGWRP